LHAIDQLRPKRLLFESQTSVGQDSMLVRCYWKYYKKRGSRRFPTRRKSGWAVPSHRRPEFYPGENCRSARWAPGTAPTRTERGIMFLRERTGNSLRAVHRGMYMKEKVGARGLCRASILISTSTPACCTMIIRSRALSGRALRCHPLAMILRWGGSSRSWAGPCSTSERSVF